MKTLKLMLCFVAPTLWLSTHAQNTTLANALTTVKSEWYDVDSDGILDYQSNRNVYVFNSTLNGVSKVTSFLGKGLWINANNDNLIDFYGVMDDGWKTGFVNLSNSDYSTIELFSGRNISPAPVDYNNDGRTDFIINEENRKVDVITLVNGKYVKSQFSMLTPEDYAGIKKDLNLYYGGTGLSFDNVVSYIPPKISTAIKSIDINNDGFVDLVSPQDGAFYQNLGDGRYVKNGFGGICTFRDFNGDELMDVLIWDKANKRLALHYSNLDMTWTEKIMFSGLHCNDNIFCFDFDKDGDVDILIPFDQYYQYWPESGDGGYFNNGGSFLMLYENKGGNSFKKHEFSYNGPLWFHDCFDINGDGYFEITAFKDNSKEMVDLVYFKINGTDIPDNPVIIKESFESIRTLSSWDFPYIDGQAMLASIDNSGNTYLLYNYSPQYNYVYGQLMKLSSSSKNTRPDAPQHVNFVYDEKTEQLKIFWSEGADKETSSVDLTYALRIGTEKNNGDMFFANANEAGLRRNLDNGNCGYSRFRTIDVSSWKAGKYYISVQSVDPNYSGSEFSDYVIFEKSMPAAGFIILHDNGFSVGDTCTITLQEDIEPQCTYQWDWAGGKIISQNGIEYKIAFYEGGEKTICLSVRNDNGAEAKIEKKISVAQGSIKPASDDEVLYNAVSAIDIDEDGKVELLSKDSQYRFFEGDAEGYYSAIKKLWNSNLPLSSSYSKYLVTADINKDGHSDIAYYTYGEAYTLINQDGELTVSDNFYNYDLYDNIEGGRYWADCNNDGFCDVFLDSEILLNDGTYQSYSEIKAPGYENILIDYDHDGLLDCFYVNSSYDSSKKMYENSIIWYRNNGDLTFTENILKSETSSGSPIELKDIGDFDGDGKWDYFFNSARSGAIGRSDDELEILWGDGSMTKIPCIDDNPFSHHYFIADVDNNGCLDIVNCCRGDKNVIIYLHKDHTFNTQVIDDTYTYILFGNDLRYVRSDGKFVANGNVISVNANEKPFAPTNLRASQSGKFVTIEWNHSVDKETPEALMQYNISIKHKGKTGEGSYLISPLNSTKNGVPVPSPHNLLIGNKFTIPLANIPAGEYEVQVQGVDRWHQESDFSEVYNLTVLAQSVIEMPTSTGVGKEVTVTIVTNSGDAVNFGEGVTAVETSAGVYTVSWNTAGQKTVTVGNLASQSIYVYPLPEAGFTLPTSVLEGATVNFTGTNISNGVWEYSLNGADFEPVAESETVKMSLGDGEKASLVFNVAGEYQVRHTVSDAFNSVECAVSVTVTGTNCQPEIAIVNINPDNGKYQINWLAERFPKEVASVNVYKETTHSNVYELLANVPVAENSYTDLASQPDVTASRYHISYVLPYGESQRSDDHQAMHVMINQGMNNTWNLNWSHYEGAEVDCYRILGGTTADNLQPIAEVSGHISSYSDIQAVGGMKYYAVEIQIGADAQPITRSSANVLSSRSNVISADDASVINFITDIVIYSETGESVMKGLPGETLQLFAYLHPFSATLRDIDWSIAEGNDFATIDKDGLLTAIESGEVTVRATAVDGSGVFDEFVVTLDLEAEGISPENIYPKNGIWPADIYDITGRMVRKGAFSTEGLHAGLYFIKGKKVLVK